MNCHFTSVTAFLRTVIGSSSSPQKAMRSIADGNCVDGPMNVQRSIGNLKGKWNTCGGSRGTTFLLAASMQLGQSTGT